MTDQPKYRPWQELRRALPTEVEAYYAASMDALRERLGREPEAFFDEATGQVIVQATGGPGRVNQELLDSFTDEDLERAAAEEGREIDWSSARWVRPDAPPKPSDS